MDRPGHLLLAAAGLPRDEHRAIKRPHPDDRLLEEAHHFGLPDHP